jgi:hypothetical protein
MMMNHTQMMTQLLFTTHKLAWKRGMPNKRQLLKKGDKSFGMSKLMGID